ncbi:MAG: DUF4358 domain-containing protein [Lachnospiraceae bacterium]|nr:DUF4358 domain-containing protein [Lachnospiraceae bacterium]
MKRPGKVVAILAALMICACGKEETDKVLTESSVETEQAVTTAPETDTVTTGGAESADPEGKEDGEPIENADAYDAPEIVSAAEIMEKVNASVTLPEMYTADDAYILNNYDIDPATLDSYAIEEALEVTQADKVIIIDPAEGTDPKEISDKLESFRQDKAMEMEDYLPEQYDVIAAASVKEKDGFVYLVISPEAEKIETLIEDSIGKKD